MDVSINITSKLLLFTAIISIALELHIASSQDTLRPLSSRIKVRDLTGLSEDKVVTK